MGNCKFNLYQRDPEHFIIQLNPSFDLETLFILTSISLTMLRRYPLLPLHFRIIGTMLLLLSMFTFDYFCNFPFPFLLFPILIPSTNGELMSMFWLMHKDVNAILLMSMFWLMHKNANAMLLSMTSSNDTWDVNEFSIDSHNKDTNAMHKDVNAIPLMSMFWLMHKDANAMPLSTTSSDDTWEVNELFINLHNKDANAMLLSTTSSDDTWEQNEFFIKYHIIFWFSMSWFEVHHNTHDNSCDKDENENIAILRLSSKYQSIYFSSHSSEFHDTRSDHASSNDIHSNESNPTGKMRLSQFLYAQQPMRLMLLWSFMYNELNIFTN